MSAPSHGSAAAGHATDAGTGDGLLPRLPHVLRRRRDVLDRRDRWATAAVLASSDAAVVLSLGEPDGDLLWALGQDDDLTALLPQALVGRQGGRRVRWMTAPRAVRLPPDALAAVGLTRCTSWDRLATDVAPPGAPGEDEVVALDPVRDAGRVVACLEQANPTTHARPGAPDDAGWWGVPGPDGSLLGVLGVATWSGTSVPSAHLHGLGVVPAARGRGWGTALAAAATRDALRGGAPWVSLHMHADNAPARRLYDALGFRVEQQNAGYGPPGATGP